MAIKSVWIKNFRGIGALSEPIELSTLNVFVGDNGTGKTSILEAINFCLSPGYIASRLGIDDFHDGTENSLEVTVEFTDTFVAKVADGYTTQDVTCKRITLIAKKREKGAPGKAFSDLVTTRHFAVPVAEPESGGWSQPRKGGSVFKFGERQLSFPAVEVDMPRAFYFDKRRTRELVKGYNSSFANVISDLNWRFELEQRSKEEADHFKHERKALHDSVMSATGGDTLKKTLEAANSILAELGLDPVSLSILKTLSPYDHSELVFPLDGYELPVDCGGSGVEMAVSLALLEAMAALSKEQLIILIDEPELHLHPKLQARLFDRLQKMASRIQVVTTTHSPLLFKNVFGNADAKLQVTRNEEQTITVSDAHSLGFGGLSWSPSWGEICYLAYELPTVEFHDDLYSTIEDRLRTGPSHRLSQDEVEQWFLNQGYTKEIHWADANGSLREETLMTYVRNRIHHPDNRNRPEYSLAQLQESIERMRSLI